jgi:hypothetical protein
VSADRHVQLGFEPLDTRYDRLRSAVAELRSEGMTFFRVTTFEEHAVAVLEGWAIPPEDQGPPPMPALVAA